MRKQKEILHKQLELLAEQSKDAIDKETANLSVAMCEIYKTLERSKINLIASANFTIVFTNSLICFVILFKKFFRRNV